MAKEHEVKIIVNTREKEWGEKTISYEQVVVLAFGSYSAEEGVVYTVEYSKGPKENSEGSLVKGQAVEVKEGMIFNVKHTNRS